MMEYLLPVTAVTTAALSWTTYLRSRRRDIDVGPHRRRRPVGRVLAQDELVREPDSSFAARRERTLREIYGLYETGLIDGQTAIYMEELQRIVLYWAYPCVDTTAYGLDVLKHLDPHRPLVLDKYLNLYRDSLISFLRSHVDEGSGGVRHHSKAKETLYATYFALHAAAILVGRDTSGDPPSRQELMKVFPPTQLDGFIRFARACERPDGGFSEWPGGEVSSACLSAGLRILGLLDEDPAFRAQHEDYIEDCKVTVDKERKVVGFAPNREDGTALVESTRQAVSSTISLRRSKGADGASRTVFVPADKMRAVMDFFEVCRASDRLGFGNVPKSKESSLIHTFHVVRAMHEGLGPTERWQIQERISVLQVCGLLLNSRLAGGGFGLVRDSEPNVFGLRTAASLTSLAKSIYAEEIVESLLRGTDPHGQPKEWRDYLADELTRFVDTQTGAFSGYQVFHRPTRNFRDIVGSYDAAEQPQSVVA
jgi:hypothetical protein